MLELKSKLFIGRISRQCHLSIIISARKIHFGIVYSKLLSLSTYTHSVMKNTILLISGLLLSIMALQSCSEDFTVSAPYKQITVVYGILNADDSAHYIRIQKAFMDENKSAIDMAQDADSSFYQNLSVRMVEYASNRTQVLNTVPLIRVNLNNEGYQKDDPINEQQFFTDPSYAYKFNNIDLPLNPANWYQLLIENKETGRTDSSELIGIVNASPAKAGDGFYVPDFDRNSFTLSFPRTLPASKFDLFVFMPKNGRMAEGYIRFNYVEKNAVTGEKVRKKADYLFDRELSTTQAGKGFSLEVANVDLYAFLNASMGLPGENIERFMDSCDVYVYAASSEIYFYDQITLGQTGGLTGDNIQPIYSNFKGDDVLGVIGSRAINIYEDVPIDKLTLDSLALNPITAPLKIKGRSED